MLTEYLYRQPGMDKLARDWVFYYERDVVRIPERENYATYSEASRLNGAVNDILLKGIHEGYSAMQNYVRAMQRISTATGGEYAKGMYGIAEHLVYTPFGIAQMRKKIGIPADDECTVIPLCRSLCGTDLSQMHEVEAGTFSKSRYGTTVGHEMFGIVVGVGKKGNGIVQIGDFVNFDSHYACEGRGHGNFDDCAKSGLGCDGIASIKGTLNEDGETRNEPIDGYFGNLVKCKISAIPGIMSADMAQQVVPSTLESLGNIAMISNHMEKIGLAKEPENTLVVVIGVGATGHQLALVASADKFPVIGIEPDPSRRKLAKDNEACLQVFDSASRAEEFLLKWREKHNEPNIIVSVMSGDEDAYQGANQLLALAGRLKFQKRVGIAFGLYGNDKSMPGDPDARRQRDVVLNRGHFVTDDGDEWFGITGRDKDAWKRVFTLYAVNSDGQLLNPTFVAKMKRTIKFLNYPSASISYNFDRALEIGSKFIHTELYSELKIAAGELN